MSTLIDARPHAAAIKAAINAHLGPWETFEYDNVPGTNENEGTPPVMFVTISLERRGNELLRSVARSGSTAWRLAVRYTAPSVDECRWLQKRTADAINEQRVVVADKPTTRMQFEPGDAPAFDDGAYSSHDFYTFVH